MVHTQHIMKWDSLRKTNIWFLAFFLVIFDNFGQCKPYFHIRNFWFQCHFRLAKSIFWRKKYWTRINFFLKLTVFSVFALHCRNYHKIGVKHRIHLANTVSALSNTQEIALFKTSIKPIKNVDPNFTTKFYKTFVWIFYPNF